MKSYVGEIPNVHVRDFQRKKLYQAEALTSFWNNIEILTRPKVKQLVTEITDWAGITSPKLSYSTRTNGRLAYATASSVVLPFPLAKSVPFICHEMSHVINYQRGPADHHGPYFAAAYLEVVHTFIGQEQFNELLEAFDYAKVKFTVF